MIKIRTPVFSLIVRFIYHQSNKKTMNRRQKIIISFMERSRDIYKAQTEDFSDMLINTWVAFDVFTSIHWGNIDSLTDRKNMFSRDYQKRYEAAFASLPKDFHESLEALGKLDIPDMRPRNKTAEPKRIIDNTNLFQVMTAIAQVRNNLLHGETEEEVKDNDERIRLSAITLFRIMELFLKELLQW